MLPSLNHSITGFGIIKDRFYHLSVDVSCDAFVNLYGYLITLLIVYKCSC